MQKIEFLAPAKINIGLNVIRKRNDGFHDILTVFHPLLLSDVIQFEKADKFDFKSDNQNVPNDNSNLIHRAVGLIEKTAGNKLPVKIKLIKNIPIGAGLGGGSSDAALTLKALNILFDLNFSANDLLKLALKLGSDVPYFLNPVSAIAESRGEIIKPLIYSISHPILVINPGIHISTKWAFSLVEPNSESDVLKKFLTSNKFDIEDLKNFVTNDFEKIVFEQFPQVAEIKLKLYSLGAEFALMSGTGSSVYGIFSNLQKARLANEVFRKNYFTYLNYPVDTGSIT